VGFINVYLNGVLLGSADYTATNGTTVVLATGAAVGNLVTIESFQVSSVLNAIPATSGSILLSGSYVTGVLPHASLPTGSVLQVVLGTTNTSVTNTTTTYADTNLTATITPRFTTSKILISIVQVMYLYDTSSAIDGGAGLIIQRNSSTIYTPAANRDLLSFYAPTGLTRFDIGTNMPLQYLDSPASISALTYKTQAALATAGAGASVICNGSGYSTITLMEIAG
jgi:hypothetical protein